MLKPQWSRHLKCPPIAVVLMVQVHPNLSLGIPVMTSEIPRGGNVRFREIIWKAPKGIGKYFEEIP